MPRVRTRAHRIRSRAAMTGGASTGSAVSRAQQHMTGAPASASAVFVCAITAASPKAMRTGRSADVLGHWVDGCRVARAVTAWFFVYWGPHCSRVAVIDAGIDKNARKRYTVPTTPTLRPEALTC